MVFLYFESIIFIFVLMLSTFIIVSYRMFFFKSKDADNLEQAFREFTAKTLSKEQRPSIRKVLSAVKQKVAAQTKQRAKEKIEERGLEL